MQKVMHLGKNNPETAYHIQGVKLQRVQEEKDLGIFLSETVKVGTQWGKAAAKGNQILGLIHRTIVMRDQRVITGLYKSLVRPHLDYCCQVCRPHLKNDIEILEKVQKRATRMIEGFKGVSYDQRLKEMGLTTLETRRLRADLIEVFKIIKEYEGLNRELFFDLKGGEITRGHEFNLIKKRLNTDKGNTLLVTGS